MDEQRAPDVPRDDTPTSNRPYEPPVAEPLEGPDPDSVAPGATSA